MPFESGLISFAAFTCMALAMKKHGSSLAWKSLPSQRVLRILGWVLLALAATTAVARLGAPLGVTTWVGQMCVAASLLVLLLSWWPRLAAILAGGAFVVAVFLALL
ncbi:DUF3325 domain-containing protein [Caulobacter sp. D4A]|uniref:DUF3325 family protein n=1 Tax=unclassified Caulobacter TaxID=2648921 RepID=UPI000D73DC88|nr:MULTISPECIES: DUF3325 family protein [unclassified Caulobacter]PXA85325.1 DUF3325 domain-containing protein [Caulobacter sp. D4A]PXA93780.1 DUF3325 domain-containing protein [Caulobacter sp. D5]